MRFSVSGQSNVDTELPWNVFILFTSLFCVYFHLYTSSHQVSGIIESFYFITSFYFTIQPNLCHLSCCCGEDFLFLCRSTIGPFICIFLVPSSGILYINATDLGWNPPVSSWIDRREVQSEKANLIILFDKYLPICLDTLRTRWMVAVRQLPYTVSYAPNSLMNIQPFFFCILFALRLLCEHSLVV